jgi:uncharacterized protein (TIGR02598 family)
MLTANDTRTPQARAFSLIEVALAVGVISFALVGIIGLFPVAMQSALDSQHETQVALIARSLFSELQRVDGDKAYITVTKPAGGERQSLDKGTLVIVNLGTASSTPTQFYFDESGGMLDANGDAAVYRADVSVNRTGQPTGLSRLDIKIQVPSNAPAANQKSYEFVTLINFAVPPPTP